MQLEALHIHDQWQIYIQHYRRVEKQKILICVPIDTLTPLNRQECYAVRQALHIFMDQNKICGGLFQSFAICANYPTTQFQNPPLSSEKERDPFNTL